MLEDSQSQRKDLAARLDSASESLAKKQAALAEQSAQLANLQEQAAATRAELEGSLKASQVGGRRVSLWGFCARGIGSSVQLLGAQKASSPPISVQVAVSERATRLERLEQDKAASDADWESRLQEAVDSAEQWKAFAEKLGKEKGELEALLADLQKRTEVSPSARGFPRCSCATGLCIAAPLCQGVAGDPRTLGNDLSARRSCSRRRTG